MIERLASPVRVVELERFSADALERIVLYIAPEAAGPLLFIVDPRPLPARDAALTELGRKRPLIVLDQVVPDPKTADIDAMAERGCAEKPAAIIGVGGGSTLDSAKAVALLCANGGSLEDYLGPTAARSVEIKGPPLVLIPTTAGTGSEVTRFGVYTARSGRKFTLASPLLRADAAILCDELVADLPAPLVAVAGYDALTHALETLWNKNATPLSDALAEDAAAAVIGSLRSAWDEASAGNTSGESTPSPARARLLRAANAAGIAFDKTGTAAIHALSFILSEEWHLPHGASCAFFSEAVYALNVENPAVCTKLARLARRIGAAEETAADADAAAALGRELGSLCVALGLASRFDELSAFAEGSDGKDREAVIDRFAPALGDPKMKNNPVPVDAALLRELIRAKLP
jgi:alcohol dehydrogenase class IV